ncbi:MAG TPA: DNA primase [Ignavibacteriales bacterium]|nr:DNA primase [Ignavibacteriales bacterium]
MKIPENKIEEIRSSADIVDIISYYVQLRKRGKNYLGLCPFHTEKTPSFTVSSDKQIYHCFGCHAGGNVFKFLMDLKNISFVEAVQEVAEKTGIQIEYEEKAASDKPTEQELLYDVNVAAARFFAEKLYQSEEGDACRKYFDKRNIKLQTQRQFGLGFSPNHWDSFVNYAREANIDFQKAQHLGLIEKNDRGGYYDKFKGRAIFPIFSPNGRIVGFGGRIIETNENTAKYLNSPESPIYSKRKVLYGLFQSKDEIRKLEKAILVEGYMDLISLFQSGVKNVVASSGTALTEEQVILLSRYAKNVVVLFDADTAGRKASLRSIEILVKKDFDVKIAELPEKEDPDSFVQKFGREEFLNLIGKAQTFLDYQAAQFEKEGKFADALQQAEAIKELVRSVSFVGDELKRSMLIKSLGQRFNLREKLLETELEKFLRGGESHSAYIRPLPTDVKPTFSEELIKRDIDPAVYSIERGLIKLLFQGVDEEADYIFQQLTPEDFTDYRCQMLAELVYESAMNEKSISPGALTELIEDESLRQYVFDNIIDKESISKAWDERTPYLENPKLRLIKETKELVRSYKTKRIQEQIDFYQKKLENLADESEMLNLIKAKDALQNERKALSNEQY